MHAMRRIGVLCWISLAAAAGIAAGAGASGNDDAAGAATAGAADAENWWQPVPPPETPQANPSAQWQTSFDEFKVGRMGALNAQATVGMPGWPVMQFGYETYLRYSEFILNLRVEHDGKEVRPCTLEHFAQRALDGWLPGVITEFDEAGVHYEIHYWIAPGEPQPVDFITIELSNCGQAAAQGALLVNLDGAPTLAAEGDLIQDRGKPLAVMVEKPEEIRTIERPAGLVDPRCVATGGGPDPDPRFNWREGFYGMPIQYMVRVEPGKEYPVCIYTDGTPPWICWGEGYGPAWRGITLTVEGAEPKRVELDYPMGERPLIHTFTGRDIDGDGHIAIASRATPESRQPALLHTIWVFEAGTTLADPQKLVPAKTMALPDHFITPQKDKDTPPSELPKARNVIYCGANAPGWVSNTLPGQDPTWRALSLRYTPRLEPGQTRRYELKLPAIDRPELMCYNNAYHPYDTGQSWMRNLAPRHPENKAAYGEDVPPGTDPADYGAYGPKPRELWARQLAATRAMTSAAAQAATRAFWEDFVAPRVKFNTPDAVLDDLYKTQLAVMGLYLLKWSDHELYTAMAGPFNYWDMCLRDGSYQLRALDMAGFHDTTRKLCDTLLTPRSAMPDSRWLLGQWDDPENDGLFLTRRGQWDSQGQTMGALVDHALLTGDREWLERTWPALSRASAWIERARERHAREIGDPKDYRSGLLPAGVLESAGEGHPYYINAYAAYGLRQAALAAKMLGHEGEATRWRAEADDLNRAIVRAARERYVRLGDYSGTLSVAPEDKGNLGTWPGTSLVYPLEVFDPFDPLIEGWHRYLEEFAGRNGGLMTQPYIQMDWAISYIRRGQPDRTVDLFNAYVDCAHPTMGWGEGHGLNYEFKEFDPPRFGVRAGGDMPHGEACSNYIIFLRNLLLHEQGRTLHVAPATPRRWMAQTKPFGAEAAPTYFGKVTFSIEPQADRKTVVATVALDPARKPERVLLHLRGPGGRGLASVWLNGQPWDAFTDETIVIRKPEDLINVEAIWNE